MFIIVYNNLKELPKKLRKQIYPEKNVHPKKCVKKNEKLNEINRLKYL